MEKDEDGKVPRCVRTGKCCFTKKTAQEVLNRARRSRRRGKKIPQRIYECQFCGCWHLTHTMDARVVHYSDERRLKRRQWV